MCLFQVCFQVRRNHRRPLMSWLAVLEEFDLAEALLCFGQCAIGSTKILSFTREDLVAILYFYNHGSPPLGSLPRAPVYDAPRRLFDRQACLTGGISKNLTPIHMFSTDS
jgi:hypothetical protein